jgi:hypothetical protein
MFGASDYAMAPPVGGSAAAAVCVVQMRSLCLPAMQRKPMLMGVSGNCCEYDPSGNKQSGCPKLVQCHGGNATLAIFLVTRPPFAYLGTGWQGCDSAGSQSKHAWDPLYDMFTGSPLELCTERDPGVFSRKWSGGSASFNCNTGESVLDFRIRSKSDDDMMMSALLPPVMAHTHPPVLGAAYSCDENLNVCATVLGITNDRAVQPFDGMTNSESVQ